jgi:site-specific DNA recombinase
MCSLADASPATDAGGTVTTSKASCAADAAGRTRLHHHPGHGGTYEYFCCLAQYGKRNDCDLPHLSVPKVEEAVEHRWVTVEFTDTEIAAFSKRARNDLHQSAESSSRLIVDQRRRLADLERQRQKLLDAYMVDALPVDVLKERQAGLGAEIADAKRLLQNAQTANEEVFARLNR